MYRGSNYAREILKKMHRPSDLQNAEHSTHTVTVLYLIRILPTPVLLISATVEARTLNLVHNLSLGSRVQ